MKNKRVSKLVAVILLLNLLLVNFNFLCYESDAADYPAGTAEAREAWYPTKSPVNAKQDALNNWQITKGKYFDGANGSTTEVRNDDGSVILRKNVIPTDDENIFKVALKVRAKASFSDVLDATSFWVQNGGSAQSAKKDYFQIKPSGAWSVPVTVCFMNAPDSTSPGSLPGSYKIVYKKTYYINPSISGMMFLYYENALVTTLHGGQKQKVHPGAEYYIPIGTTMQSYDQLHHAAVARSVTDTMGDRIDFIDVLYKTTVPGVNGMTNVSVSGNTLTWNIDSDGTVPVGEDYQFVKETKNGKTVYYREYDLVYRVHLDTSDPDFVPGKSYETNSNATLSYTFDSKPESGVSDYQDYPKGSYTLDFPKPAVKGTLYSLTFKKVDSETGEPLKGAKFSLSGAYGVSQLGLGVTGVNPAISKSKTTDETGVVTFDNLPWGNYTLTEVSAPKGYSITFAGMTKLLCETRNPTILEKDGDNYKLKSSQIGNDGVISNDKWGRAKITVKKDIDNFSDILSSKDKNSEFSIDLSGFDMDEILLADKNNKFLTVDELEYLLKHNDEETFYIYLKNDEGTFDIEELLADMNKSFEYVSTDVKANDGNSTSKGKASIDALNGAKSEVKVFSGNNVTITVHNRYRLSDLDILKVDSVDHNLKLSGASFDIYTSEAEDVQSTDKTITYNGKTYYYLKSTSVSGEDGKAYADKLPVYDRKYVMIEGKAPEGYFSKEMYIPFSYDENGINISSGDEHFVSDGVIKIVNHKYYELPETGGIGIYPFVIAGAFVAAMAAIMLRRKNENY